MPLIRASTWAAHSTPRAATCHPPPTRPPIFRSTRPPPGTRPSTALRPTSASTWAPRSIRAAAASRQTVVLARGGTTSACSFKVSTSIARDRVNLSFGGRLCQQGSNNCTSRGGWFWFGDEVALCDATCLAWESERRQSGPRGRLCVGELLRGVSSARRRLRRRHQFVLRRLAVYRRLVRDVRVRAARPARRRAIAAAETCKNGACVDGLGGTCVSQAGCSQGECRDGRCQCAADQISCNTGCVSYLDPNNCRGCGNVCPTGTGRVCTANGCVCDPQSAFPDECNGVCVNKSNDRTNCGFCFMTCPKLEQVCNSGVCGCPGGQTDCNGSCVDTTSSQNHCGMCNRGCPAGVEVCAAGNCACAPGYTRCSGNCVNLLTNKLNCSACGMACPGNKTCNNGSCG